MPETGDFYVDTAFYRDAEGDAHPISNVEVTVVKKNGDPAQIYYNELLSDVKDNPFITTDDGDISFWADEGQYEIQIRDLAFPQRMADRDIAWMSIPYDDYASLRFTGEVVMGFRDVPPEGWLICDGSEVERTQYARLFAAIGTKGGPGDGATTFNLPDFQGRPPYGVGTHNDVLEPGANDGNAPEDRTPHHKHSLVGHTHTQAHTHSGNTEAFTGNTAGGGAHAHAFEGGKLIHSRRNVPITSVDDPPISSGGQIFNQQSLYIAGFNSHETGPANDEAADMDPVGDHVHNISHQHAYGTGQPSNASTGGPSVADTGGDSSTGDGGQPWMTVYFYIRYF